MAKAGLGRGLGELMNGDKVAGKSPTPTSPAATEELFGRGVQTLLKSNDPASKAVAETDRGAKELPEDEPLSIPTWFFFGTDLLLLALAMVLVLGPKPLPKWNIALALLCVVIGCFSAIVGVRTATRR
ncbi:MAG TPA: hypothetical protein VEH27_13520 [Methylomirabilota bacterium]|nr:hypothetical protein [Methylomirabilota bacterium]